MENNRWVAAEWADDCQGKKDFDGPIVSVSTRYWPRGGGMWIFNTATGHIQENDERPEIKPSASCSICIDFKDQDGDADSTDLIKQRFEGESEDEVKKLVESFVDAEFRKIANHLKLLYP